MNYILVSETPHGQACTTCRDIAEALFEVTLHHDYFVAWVLLDHNGECVLTGLDEFPDYCPLPVRFDLLMDGSHLDNGHLVIRQPQVASPNCILSLIPSFRYLRY